MLTVLVALASVGCGGQAEGEGAEQESVEVRFTREDGSAARFPESVRAWCGPFDEDNPEVEAIHILAGELPDREEGAEPFWVLRAVRADVERDPETTLPNDYVYTEPRGADLFALDDAEHRHNELSSATERAAGTIRVELSGCEPGDAVEVDFGDVTLGSEYGDLPAISVDGSAVVQVGDPP